MGFNDEPMIRTKKYSEEKYKMKKAKSYGVAKKIIIMSELAAIFGKNALVSLGLFLLLCLGTGAMPYVLGGEFDFNADTFSLRGGLFIMLSVIFLILYMIFGFWYAIEYKRLEIMCIHLDGELEGAAEVNDAMGKVAAGVPTNFSSISGPEGLAQNYLMKNKVKTDNFIIIIMILKAINTVLVLGQIITAILCLIIWMHKY
ncbi:MAG: hypothetical protein LUI12_02490 [Clostridiales bacterium]|nr:hypothetical protein [Clostridiales bacterium]